MPATNRIQGLYLSYFSKPAGDRPVYQAIKRLRPASILELGVGTGQRAVRMIELAAQFHPMEEIVYHGIDLFEARTSINGSGTTLKLAHQLLRSTGASIQLIPGDTDAALSRVANSLGQIDLLVVSFHEDSANLGRAWRWVPRLLLPETEVFVEEPASKGAKRLRRLTCHEIETHVGDAELPKTRCAA